MGAPTDSSPALFFTRGRFPDQDGGDLPDAPPAAVLRAVDAAMARVDRLAAMDRELRFSVDGAEGLEIQVRTLSGALIRRISAEQALAVAHASCV